MNNLSRTSFSISTDTGGDFVDTGPPMSGMVLQLVLDTGAFDTGCDFKLETVQSKLVVAHYTNSGGSQWTRSPRVLTYDTGGTEVGNQQPVLAGDRLRLTVTQSDGVTGSKTGKLHIWTGW